MLIDDDADRADAVAEFLERSQLTSSFLNALVQDRYDVIRAEALDCAITGDAPIDRHILRVLAGVEAASLVRGRLKLYLTLSGFNEELEIIDSRDFADMSLRDEPWNQACEYCKHRDGKSFLAMTRFLFEDDYGTAEITLDLMLLLATVLHRKMLYALLTAAASLPELKISKTRLSKARQQLASETLSLPSLVEIRSQLS